MEAGKIMKTRRFGGRAYYLYGTSDGKTTARQVAQAVREKGGKARVIGTSIYASLEFMETMG